MTIAVALIYSLKLLRFLLTASFSEDLGGVVNLVDKYGYDVDEGMIPREQTLSRYVILEQETPT